MFKTQKHLKEKFICNVDLKNSKKSIKGITLIALVITIIVLLILAGVTIATLFGENGILTKAKKSKEETEIAELKERVQTDISGIQAGNNGELSKAQLVEILSKYFDNVPSAGNLPENLSTVILTSKDQYGNYQIKLSDMWNSTFRSTLFADVISSENYGDYVEYGIDLNDDNDITNDWRIFYNDGTNIFIISDDYLLNNKLPSSTDLVTWNESQYSVYWPSEANLTKTGASNIDHDVADKFMFSWVKENSNSTNNNIKAVATLLDTTAWSSFASGISGAEAIGSPTLEMYIASWNEKGYTPLYCNNTTTYGYYVGLQDKPTTHWISISSDIGYSDTLYFPHQEPYYNCNGYWLASTSSYDSNRVRYVILGDMQHGNYNTVGLGIRPVVWLPTNTKAIKNEDNIWNIW